MIKKARFRYTLIIVSLIAIILIGVCSGILISTYVSQVTDNNHLLSRVFDITMREYDDFVPVVNEETDRPKKQEMRTFSIVLKDDERIITYDENFFTIDEIEAIYETIDSKNKTSGYINNVYFKKFVKQDIVVYAGIDRTIELNSYNILIMNVFIFGSVALIVLIVLFYSISWWIFKPAEDAHRLQKEFIADVSHELKTPITGIKLNIDLLKGDIKDNKWLTNLENDAERLEELTKEILYLNEIENIDYKGNKENVNLSDILLKELDLFEVQISKSKHILKKNIEYNIEQIISPDSFKKAIDIIIKNCIMHATINTEISVEFYRDGKTSILKVKNEATSIKEKDKDHLFERFYRGDKSRNRKTGGNGLGLSILKKLVDSNNWKIDVNIEEDKLFEIILKIT